MLIELNYEYETETLLDNFKITKGKIIDLGNPSGKGGSPPIYKYEVDSKVFKSNMRSNSYCGFNLQHITFNKIKKHYFPVVYIPYKPETSRILLKIEDYQKYNVPIPDTLAEVLVEYFNCDNYKVIRREGKQTKIVKIN